MTLSRFAKVILLALCVCFAEQSVCAQVFSVLHTFTDGHDGGQPLDRLALDSAGNLYGTTYSGGDFGPGNVFKISASGEFTVLYSFTGGLDGGQPVGGVILDRSGNLYGTTFHGGTADCGVVFKLSPSREETVLYSFGCTPDGANPTAGQVRDGKGNLYGITQHGGASNHGTVFKLDKKGTETILHSFTGSPDGSSPYAALIRDSKGNLYGTTGGGGVSDYGIIFKIDVNGTETVLYRFRGGHDGGTPFGGVIRDSKGNLYGTTQGPSFGLVYKLDSSGKETPLYTFSGGSDGGFPMTDLTRDSKGTLYGTTYHGGIYSQGTVFKLDKKGNESVLHSFTLTSDGANPLAGVVRDAAGNLYGTTDDGGDSSNSGVVFKVAP